MSVRSKRALAIAALVAVVAVVAAVAIALVLRDPPDPYASLRQSDGAADPGRARLRARTAAFGCPADPHAG